MSTPPDRSGFVLVASGPSGAGKTTLCRRLLESDANLRFSVSCTTRPARPCEVDGRDYHFIPCAEFQQRVANGEFLEHAEVHGNHYGTLTAQVCEALQAGIDILLDIDVQGARQLREQPIDPRLRQALVFVFIGPPSGAELERRLRGRGTESEAVIQRRLGMARAELAHWRLYDYLLINADLEVAYADLTALVATARMHTARIRGNSPWPDIPDLETRPCGTC